MSHLPLSSVPWGPSLSPRMIVMTTRRFGLLYNILCSSTDSGSLSITEFLQVHLPRLLVLVPCHHNSVFAMYTMYWLGSCKSSLTFAIFSSPHIIYNVPSTKHKSMHTYLIPYCERAMLHERGKSYIKRWCFVSGVNSSKQVLVNVHAYIWHVQGHSCVLPDLIKQIQVNRVTILFETIAQNWKR